VVVADAQAEVYMAPEDREYPEFLGVYGCSYKHKRSYFLGRAPSLGGGPGNSGGVELEALAGPTVAYWEAGSPGDMEVRSLINGRVLHQISAPGTENIGPVSGIVVKSDGAVAWISEPLAGGPCEVHAVDKNGSRLLASSTEVDPSSLALAGSTLYWTQGGKPMSSPLN
jgi:hypothetical protein